MRNPLIDTLWRVTSRAARPVTITAVYALMIAAYFASAWVADVGDTVLGPPIVQEGLRALIVMNVARAFTLRWAEFTPVQRAGWLLLALGVTFNLARSHFSGTPLTLAFALGHGGLLVVTYRLMAVTGQLRRLAADNAELRARLTRLEAPHDHP